MKLTKRKALEICLELWQWCAETGLDKADWPGWHKYGQMDADCPCCEYVRQHPSDHCPIWKACHGRELLCMNKDYPFCDWLFNTSLKGSKRHAHRMVELIQTKLKECK